ncbi:isoprenylcysteine carboxyl methyltransferase family protein [Thermoflavimicrobium dichotomicum]|uniref:Methyltransferase n=1 Tax=Thermoflavimicrobium dichotomicum TaxID=46223 RepID=A0A1I3LUC7_9BACL|nr:isoprenylcysteine carboxylmethyltransferase family protein [Thermoflavimicrobium dichotomicum]SFI88394.1 methyltransferase [Thermoflavimicrobium dichotomicum]
MFEYVLWLVVIQRCVELLLAKKNAAWIKEQGGYEIGRKHYPLLVAVHVLFFAGMLLEKEILHAASPSWWWLPFLGFMLAQGLRWWCIHSLGPYWNTRIWVVPGHVPLAKGPYRYLRHPNYVAVIIEFVTLPLAMGAYLTAWIASIINLVLLLFVRIPAEERALGETTCYEEIMTGKSRFLPRK